MCGGNMNRYSVSGAKPQPPNVFLDIIGAYVSAGWGKVAVIFFCHTPKKWGVRVPLVPPVSYAYVYISVIQWPFKCWNYSITLSTLIFTAVTQNHVDSWKSQHTTEITVKSTLIMNTWKTRHVYTVINLQNIYNGGYNNKPGCCWDIDELREQLTSQPPVIMWWTFSIPQFNNLSLTFYCLSGGLDPPLSLADRN